MYLSAMVHIKRIDEMIGDSDGLLKLMKGLGVKKIRLEDEHKWFMGNVMIDKNGGLKYDYQYANRRYRADEAAFEHAYKFLQDNAGEIKAYNSKRKKVFETGMEYKDYDTPSKNHIEKLSTTRGYASNDAKESGVVITPSGNVRGTIDQLRKFKSLTNNHYRYCRCGYSYTNDEVNDMLQLAVYFDLFEPYSSFDEYYTGSVVD